MERNLSEQEKICIRYAAFDPRNNWQNLYFMCHPDKKNISPKSVATTVSKWKLSKPVQDYLKTCLAEIGTQYETYYKNRLRDDINAGKIVAGAGVVLLDDQKKKKRKGTAAGADSSENSKNGLLPGDVNFTNRNELLDYLNKAANEITDPKRQTEYIKMIAELLQFKDENKKDNNIQRFYTPITCQNCALYQARKAELSED